MSEYNQLAFLVQIVTSSLSKLRATCGELCAFVNLATETLLPNATYLDNMISSILTPIARLSSQFVPRESHGTNVFSEGNAWVSQAYSTSLLRILILLITLGILQMRLSHLTPAPNFLGATCGKVPLLIQSLHLGKAQDRAESLIVRGYSD